MNQQNHNSEKKTYTTEDHLKGIFFGIKDLTKAVEKLVAAVEKKKSFTDADLF